MSTLDNDIIKKIYGSNFSSPFEMENYSKSINETTSTDTEWVITQAVRSRYRLQFIEQNRNEYDHLSRNEAKAFLLQFGLRNSILDRIWNLSDIDRDGKLNCEEFCVAMYLVEQARAGRALPSKLPDTLIPPPVIIEEAPPELQMKFNSFHFKLIH